VRFIVMSGNGGDRAPVLAAGADEYLAKPFSIPDLLRLIEGFA
jgi:DNA-binding response OmpR family regulator